MRDRIGIKPLYFSVHHGRIVFGSEIKALLQDPDQERAVDEESFFHYLSFLTTPAPRTLFRGINKLPGGMWMRITADGAIREQRYWDPLDNAEPLTGVPEAEIAERILDELRTSVQLRKVSDVPVGVFLSGGIDSSTNAALFSEGERGHGEDVLDRLRGRVRELQERAPLRAADGRARRRRAPRAAAHRRRPARLPAEDGAAPGRADRRPGLRPRLLRLEARARQRRHRRPGRRGRRRALLGLPGVEGLPQPPALRRPAGAVRAEARRGRRGDADGQGRAARGGVPAPRRRRPADLLGRRRGVHAHAEAAPPLHPPAPRARRPQLLGRDRADPRSASTSRPGSARRSRG